MSCFADRVGSKVSRKYYKQSTVNNHSWMYTGLLWCAKEKPCWHLLYQLVGANYF